MQEPDSFDVQQFHDLLLAGVRTAFQTLQAQFANEGIYFYALCHPVDLSTIEPGIQTEAQLEDAVMRFRQGLRARQKSATAAEVRDLLRYDVPPARLRLGSQANASLSQAQAMAAVVGERFFADENLDMRLDDPGDPAPASPLEVAYDAIQPAMQRVLLALDAEGLFGVGEARERVVIDLMWFEGGMSQSLPYLLGQDETPPTPLNPAPVQDRYHDALQRAMQTGRRLFSS